MDAATTTWDTVLALHITTVSRLLDDVCGPVVQRTVTDEVHDGGSRVVVLNRRPVSAVTTVSEVTAPGTVTVLTAAAFGSSTDGYYAPAWERDPTLKSGVLHRQRGGSPIPWGPGVKVSYTAGRYANTAAVDARFADTAGAVLRRLWKRESGTWAQTPSFFEDGDNQAGIGFFRVARPIIDELLPADIQGRAPLVA